MTCTMLLCTLVPRSCCFAQRHIGGPEERMNALGRGSSAGRTGVRAAAFTGAGEAEATRGIDERMAAEESFFFR